MADAARFLTISFRAVLGAVLVIGLYASSLYSYLLFHTLVELFSVLTAFAIFVLAWNTRNIIDSHYVLFMGIALLFTGALDLLHTLSYKGMGVFPGYDANLATELWIAFRYLFGISFLLAAFFIRKKPQIEKTFMLYTIVLIALVVAIFGGWFPDCFVEGAGLTRFKIASEYVVCLILLASLVLLILNRQSFNFRVLRLMILAHIFSIASGLSFTQYMSVYGFFNMLGHLFLLVSVVFIYLAIVVTGLVKPSELLFRNLKQSEEAIRASETKYRLLFENMIDGFAYHRIVTDGGGRPVDYVFLEVNKAFETMTGLKRETIIGKGVRTVLPGIESDPADWIGVYGGVALTGREVRFERQAEPMKKWFSVTAYSPGKEHFVTIFEDITKRKQAESALQYSLRRFELLAHTSTELLQMAKPQTIVESLCKRLMEHFDCHVFFNYLVDEQAGRLRLNACSGISREEAKRIEWLDFGTAVCGIAAREGCRIVAEHIPTTRDSRTELVRSYGIKAYACHPLMGPGGKVIGTLSFGTRTRETFSDDDLSLMKAVSDQVTVAMLRLRDEQVLRHAEKLSRAVNEINTVIHSTQDHDEIMRTVIAYAAAAIGSESAAISRRRNGGWLITHSFGFPQEIVGLELSDDQERHTVLAITTGKPLVVQDAFNDERVNREHMKSFGIRAVLVLPLVVEDTSAAIYFNYHSSATTFSDAQIDFANKLGASVSLAIENAWLFSEMEKRVSERTYELARANEELEQEVRVRIAAEKELRKSEERFRTSVENLLDGFAIFSAVRDAIGTIADFRYEYVNESGCRLNGCNREEQAGRTLLELQPSLRGSERFEEYVRVVNTGEPLAKSDLIFEDRDGGRRLMRAFDVQAVKLGDGFTVVWRDVTERRDTERRIALTNELLELYTRKFSRKEYLNVAVELIRDWSECRHTGIRIADRNGNIPYESCAGYSPDFVAAESRLSIRDDQCLCTRVVAGSPDPSELIAMTPNGSFYSNESLQFVEGQTQNQKARYRDMCMRQEFRSLAVVPIRHRDMILGAIHIADEDPGRVPLANVEFIEQLAFIIGEALFRFGVEEDLLRQREELVKMNEQLRNLSAHVDAVREGERTSIAREIHDELGQVLTAIKMDVSWLGKRLAGTEKKLADKAGETLQIIDGAIQSVKRISAELRPGILDDIGLSAAIDWACKDFMTRTGIKCAVSIRPEGLTVDRMRSTALFRILQESLTNIMRHAKASRVTVSLEQKNRAIHLTVKDNGEGITDEDIQGSHAFGLIGMRERVQFLGGEVSITGVQNRGTTVAVALPIDSSKEAKRNDQGQVSGR